MGREKQASDLVLYEHPTCLAISVFPPVGILQSARFPVSLRKTEVWKDGEVKMTGLTFLPATWSQLEAARSWRKKRKGARRLDFTAHQSSLTRD